MVEQSDNYWPGKRFGLPEEGPRSTPGWNRRIAGIIIDWVLALGLSALFFGFNNLSILGVFVLLHIIGGLLAAGSPGHLLMKIRIAPIAGGRLGILAPVVRPLLIALVIPALMSDDDRRGAHDRLVGTILVTR
ncbi:RDD family membrane protein [Pontimonas salivibrio]|uniref:RDD family membrane protein n=1 Tax=Pontimonas salivibrio TaxID=1159327 RepID=A0A2L2BQE5_9MICO|nr:RDD family membrane protein [Pontimonas salivibrio]